MPDNTLCALRMMICFRLFFLRCLGGSSPQLWLLYGLLLVEISCPAGNNMQAADATPHKCQPYRLFVSMIN